MNGMQKIQVRKLERALNQKDNQENHYRQQCLMGI
jgi:hypothetical protein